MTELQAGVTLRGRYVLDDKIGSGGFGLVWSARDSRTGGRVAVKVLGDQAVANTDARARFEREAEVLLSLDHPGIVRALDFFSGDAETPAFLVLELISGRPLAHAIRSRTRTGHHFTVQEVRALFAPICHAVEAAHARGIVHRDLKPLNVMLVEAPGAGPPIRVLDFGLAKLMHGEAMDATTLGRRLGSFLYMSPEQVLAHPPSERTDVFALGTILFELLTLRRAWARDDLDQPLPALGGPMPFKSANGPAAILRRIAKGDRPRPSRSRPDLPVQLDELLGAAMAIDPRARPSSVGDLRSRFEDLVPGDGPESATALTMVDDLMDELGGATTQPDPGPRILGSAGSPSQDLGSAIRQDILRSSRPDASSPSPDLEVAAARIPVLELADDEPREVSATVADEAPAASAAPGGPPRPPPAPRLMAAPRRGLALLVTLIAGALVLIVVIVSLRDGAELTPAPVERSSVPAAVTPRPSVTRGPAPPSIASSPAPTSAPTPISAPTSAPTPISAPTPTSAPPPTSVPTLPSASTTPSAPPPTSAPSLTSAPPPTSATRPPSSSASSAQPTTRRPPPARSARAASTPELGSLRRRLANLRAAPRDVEAFEALSAAIARAAAQTGDEEREARIRRIMHSASVVGDIDALADCIRILERP